MSDLNDLNINEEWRENFELFQQINAHELFIFDAIKSEAGLALDQAEKKALTFNLYAFLLGPLYYFLKQMWHKGFIILGTMTIACLLGILIVKLLHQPVIIGICFSLLMMFLSMLLCAKLANYDYFKLRVDEVYIWQPFAKFSNPFFLFLFPVVIIALSASILLALLLPFTPACDDKKVIKMVDGLKRAQYARFFGSTVMYQISTSLHTIKMKSINYKTGVKTCKGDYHVTNQGKTNIRLVVYLIENSKNGKNFYVALQE